MVEAGAVALMVLALAFAVWRPRGLPEATVAVPAAAVAIAVGAVTLGEAFDEIRTLATTVATLAALLALSHACEVLGVFDWVSRQIGRAGAGNGRRLFALGFVGAAVTTAALNLDATVVLLTPVLIAVTRGLGVRPRPLSVATISLANAASSLMPVSNLTNLLAFSATGLSFGRFTVLMALPWLATLVVQYAVHRWWFRAEIADVPDHDPQDPGPTPVAALCVLGATLVGFVLSSQVGVEPVWFATAGAVVLTVIAVARRASGPVGVVRAINPLFLLFVFALGVLVAAIADGSIGRWLGGIIPTGSGLLALLGVAAIGAVVANVINNIPATLLLLAAMSGAPTVALLAMLLGVNIGSNLTYVGSLANLLWRRIVSRDGVEVSAVGFSALGLVAGPPSIIAAVAALWLVS
ncbi:SLC13 family permease [Williamsia serinedens]|uniref:Arsenite efflux membrane protein ArsB (TC 3.A.4.1.1 TC 2.A.45.1.1) n=1 Tax=Williamsia serinedens TaxID=391736 RepID=A0ABT1H5T5_9NOCA|nr:SLC13 family permease [Williamsia serinedens]MCP2162602.1 arsenite efflux membrane protein ArsB (TC 3.A.4.1.1; TC 2.A.45.1.1) [Williamsia serinedens]